MKAFESSDFGFTYKKERFRNNVEREESNELCGMFPEFPEMKMHFPFRSIKLSKDQRVFREPDNTN